MLSETHLIHGIGLGWYKDIIPLKTLYFDFQLSYIIGDTISIPVIIDAALIFLINSKTVLHQYLLLIVANSKTIQCYWKKNIYTDCIIW